MPKAGREKKILIDYLRNNRGATSIASFSTRARPAATVAVPLAWDELEPHLRPDRFTVKTVPERLASLREDPWKRYFSSKQKVPGDLARLLIEIRQLTPPRGPKGTYIHTATQNGEQ